jgi:Flp pilus assembly pilin Flp
MSWRALEFHFGWLVSWLARGESAREEGQSMVEYAIVVALIALVAMAAVQGLGEGIVQVFQAILAKIQGLGA